VHSSDCKQSHNVTQSVCSHWSKYGWGKACATAVPRCIQPALPRRRCCWSGRHCRDRDSNDHRRRSYAARDARGADAQRASGVVWVVLRAVVGDCGRDGLRRRWLDSPPSCLWNKVSRPAAASQPASQPSNPLPLTVLICAFFCVAFCVWPKQSATNWHIFLTTCTCLASLLANVNVCCFPSQQRAALLKPVSGLPFGAACIEHCGQHCTAFTMCVSSALPTHRNPWPPNQLALTAFACVLSACLNRSALVSIEACASQEVRR
jgi:hypothetical protein